jgi:carboxyl-terminal processing protease
MTDPFDPSNSPLPAPDAAPTAPPPAPPGAGSGTAFAGPPPTPPTGVGFAAPTQSPSDAAFSVPPAQVTGVPAARPVRSTGYGKWLVVVLVPVIAIMAFAGGVATGRTDLLSPQAVVSASPSPATGNADLDLIEEAWNTIHQNYVDAKNLNDRDLAYGAIRGMTDAVGDEGHTSFMTAEEAKAVDQSLSGTFVGIGVQVNSDESKGPIISSIIPNSPAEASTLQRGDKIVEVDGWKTDGHTIDEVVSRVRGPEGEPVTLTIERAGTDDFEVTITRRQFDLPLVSWGMIPGHDVAMIRLEQFATGATKAIEGAITDAKKAGATGIILDLRGNPGGYVNEAIGVASQFVGDGVVYQSIDASGKAKDVDVQPGGLYTSGPLVVLANGDSASSAEIVTGAIQDAKRGTVVGEKTFGTGTVLGRFDLKDGSSMRIGVERWLTRGGRPIWHEGLEPDVKVELADSITPLLPDDLKNLSAADLAKSPDVQVLRAIQEVEAKR